MSKIILLNKQINNIKQKIILCKNNSYRFYFNQYKNKYKNRPDSKAMNYAGRKVKMKLKTMEQKKRRLEIKRALIENEQCIINCCQNNELMPSKMS